MRRVIIRDDDTNAFTPPECLEQLYRPFLDRGMPVNLAVIPAVRRDAKTPNGKPEAFLFGTAPVGQIDNLPRPSEINPLASNPKLVEYLRMEPCYRIVQHGCHHTTFEFGIEDQALLSQRLREGMRHLAEAGFAVPQTFVAPHDRLSRAAFRIAAEHFRIISTGWFQWRRLPRAWWPNYLLKKLRRSPHWRVGKTLLLSHPGCLLSRFRPREQILDRVKRTVAQSPLTVLVTHWWEYFPEGKPDDDLIALLHQVGNYLASQTDLQVSAFEDLLKARVTPVPSHT